MIARMGGMWAQDFAAVASCPAMTWALNWLAPATGLRLAGMVMWSASPAGHGTWRPGEQLAADAKILTL